MVDDFNDRRPAIDTPVRPQPAIDTFLGASVQNAAGNWVPSPPLPVFVGYLLRRIHCQCGEDFKTEDQYLGHYAYHHMLMEEPTS